MTSLASQGTERDDSLGALSHNGTIFPFGLHFLFSLLSTRKKSLRFYRKLVAIIFSFEGFTKLLLLTKQNKKKYKKKPK